MHGPAGFASSNVSKGFLVLTGIFSVVAQLTKKTQLFNLDLALVGQGQVWRLLTHQLVWSSTGELLLGSALLYIWRMFERQFGTRKFGGCLAFVMVCSTIVQAALLAFSRGVASSNLPQSSGPYSLCFAMLAMFFMDIPVQAPFTLFGVLPLSDKLFVYLLGLQLSLSSVPGSSYTALIGLVLGFLYRIEALPFHRLRVPQWLAHCFGTVFSPLLSGSLFNTIAGLDRRAQGHRIGQVGGRVGGRVPAAVPAAATHSGGYAAAPAAEPEGEVLYGGNDGYAAAPVEPNPAAVSQLVAMGFSEAASRAALQATSNNVTAATNRLLGL